ncbi:hypothetical protein BKA70DRAFT_1041779, partial [Coprinopsis sp. MPI-PUGE-AT-0042]
FPPTPPSEDLLLKIASGFCNDSDPCRLEEAGCAVCGELHPRLTLTPMTSFETDFFDPLNVQGISRLPRQRSSDPILDVPGPVLDHRLDKVCSSCVRQLKKSRIPRLALANGLWLGEVPNELSNLTFDEKLPIARVRHNRCVVRVTSGRAKMIANVIMFANPMPEVY